MRCGGVRVIIILSGDDGAGIMAATQTRDSQDTHTYWKMSSRYCYYDLIISLPGKQIYYDKLVRPCPRDMVCYQSEIVEMFVVLLSSIAMTAFPETRHRKRCSPMTCFAALSLSALESKNQTEPSNKLNVSNPDSIQGQAKP